ncbi:MAG: hypothetical protein K9L61_00750 [Candidatus Omnitrophica bacterium]|nr:hypothetical protein [Candidatus Omnitrophota bacterium]
MLGDNNLIKEAGKRISCKKHIRAKIIIYFKETGYINWREENKTILAINKNKIPKQENWIMAKGKGKTEPKNKGE